MIFQWFSKPHFLEHITTLVSESMNQVDLHLICTCHDQSHHVMFIHKPSHLFSGFGWCVGVDHTNTCITLEYCLLNNRVTIKKFVIFLRYAFLTISPIYEKYHQSINYVYRHDFNSCFMIWSIIWAILGIIVLIILLQVLFGILF